MIIGQNRFPILFTAMNGDAEDVGRFPIVHAVLVSKEIENKPYLVVEFQILSRSTQDQNKLVGQFKLELVREIHQMYKRNHLIFEINEGDYYILSHDEKTNPKFLLMPFVSHKG